MNLLKLDMKELVDLPADTRNHFIWVEIGQQQHGGIRQGTEPYLKGLQQHDRLKMLKSGTLLLRLRPAYMSSLILCDSLPKKWRYE